MALVAFYGCRTTATRTKQRCLGRATPMQSGIFGDFTTSQSWRSHFER
ncbi:MAG: hypothetical protein RMY64_11790 [Nostoc sp. DedQUE08]|nr:MULTISPECIES: hypothetical protein [unclassified Nostoc]MDZ8066301.1 hypothetical protein [Nostoc sp. DedQUE08]MDZ8094280.1 hypothetical protein [Nostoc sp. DedQUE05]